VNGIFVIRVRKRTGQKPDFLYKTITLDVF